MKQDRRKKRTRQLPFAGLRHRLRARLGQRMVAAAIGRTTKHYRRPLHVNGAPTPFQIVRITAQRTVADQVAPLAIWPELECYLLTHVPRFDTRHFVRPCDLVVCDRDWRAVAVHRLVAPNTALEFPAMLANVWILPPDATVSLKIAKGAYVSTRGRGAGLER